MLNNQGQSISFIKTPGWINLVIPSTFLLGLMATPAMALTLKPLGTYSTGIFDDGASLISAFDPKSANLFVTNQSTNSIDILNIQDPTNPFLKQSIDITQFDPSFGTVLSVGQTKYQNTSLFAVAVKNIDTQAPGSILFFNPDGTLFNSSLEKSSVQVGALPDTLTFTPDGKKVLVANEGEANYVTNVNPEGSISLIDLEKLFLGESPTQKFIGLTDFNVGGSKYDQLGESVRIFGPDGITVAQSLEPEYIAVSDNGKKAWVTFQENNAVGLLDLITEEFTKIVGLGVKDYSLPENSLDVSDRDQAINIKNYSNLYGFYQPDEAKAYQVGGKNYVVIANEGSSIDEDGFSEEVRVADLVLDPTAFPNAAELQKKENLGRLIVTNQQGDTDGDGDFDELYTFGGRSFSILDEEGNIVFDSGNQFEKITADLYPKFFNSDNSVNDFDSRSDAKGPEPEGITIGKIKNRTYAFIGLERISGVMIYDITDPLNPSFVNYSNNRNFNVAFDVNADGDPAPTPEQLLAVGDLGTEGVLFISAKDSPTGKPLVVTANEISGTTTINQVAVPEPGTILGLLTSGVLGGLFLKRKRSGTIA
ncbi:choice-of-anchor I family protein [Planktothrix mougeotii]|uniref:Choice-of-anchor I family protein n=1 Tax=Planktothrix mougeotii LEGE 06226 TaxID=1828728 RepID=A0ABR9UKP6_9CYAN|nr:choice-of-anchor I family protein [Planktothrix mougeotii]MBE9146741.1 choice-of-anchor I family protein [Planktothrix mougeotii LEGE 06226]